MLSNKNAWLSQWPSQWHPRPCHVGIFICIASIAVGSLGVRAATESEAKRRPNILLILADDLGYSDLGCYGSEIQTPNLDRLAANGLRFTQFYNTARCWPTRGALLTGYYAQQIRRDVIPGDPPLALGDRPAWAKLLPAMLKPAGYRSYHSGKWHIDSKPVEGGFDRSYWVDDQDRYFSPQKLYQDDRPLPAVKRDAGYYATTAIADHAVECLKDHAAKHGDQPFFEYLAFTSPHFPIQALPADIERYRTRYREGWDAVRQERWERMQAMGVAKGTLPAVEPSIGPKNDRTRALEKLGPGEINRPRPWDELTAEQADFQATKMAIHAAMIDRMDREIGRVLDQVRAMGAWDNTLILFLSDNGASAEIMVRGDGHDRSAPLGSADSFLCLGPGWSTVSNAPFRRHKTWVFEGGISTPLVVHWPGGVAAKGEFRRNPGHVVDIVPTILELAGVKGDAHPASAPPSPGKSLVPVFERDGSVSHDYLWWLHNGTRAIRVGDWKLVADKGAPWELYDLCADRAESANLATEHPEKVGELAKKWSELLENFRLEATVSK
jgi:arylsulfatase A-like enzyme